MRQCLPKTVLEAIERQPVEKDGLVWHKQTSPRPEVSRRSNNGDPIDVFWFGKVLKVRCEKAKVEPFKAHALRHAAASWAAAVGASPWAIKEHLGHSALSTTERYSHPQSGSKLGGGFFYKEATFGVAFQIALEAI